MKKLIATIVLLTGGISMFAGTDMLKVSVKSSPFMSYDNKPHTTYYYSKNKSYIYDGVKVKLAMGMPDAAKVEYNCFAKSNRTLNFFFTDGVELKINQKIDPAFGSSTSDKKFLRINRQENEDNSICKATIESINGVKYHILKTASNDPEDTSPFTNFWDYTSKRYSIKIRGKINCTDQVLKKTISMIKIVDNE